MYTLYHFISVHAALGNKKNVLTSRFLDTTFFTTAGNRSDASFPLATICRKYCTFVYIIVHFKHCTNNYNGVWPCMTIGWLMSETLYFLKAHCQYFLIVPLHLFCLQDIKKNMDHVQHACHSKMSTKHIQLNYSWSIWKSCCLHNMSRG